MVPPAGQPARSAGEKPAVFLVVFLLVPVLALVALVALEARLHRTRSFAGAAGMPTAFDRPELHGKGRNRVH